jgi:hypothetical protein
VTTFEEIMADPACAAPPIVAPPTHPRAQLRSVPRTPAAPATPGGAAALDAIEEQQTTARQAAAKAARQAAKEQTKATLAQNGEGHADHVVGVFRFHAQNTFHGFMFDKVTGAYVPSFEPAVIDQQGIKHLYAVHGTPPPELSAIPPGEFRFEPGNSRLIEKLPSGMIVVNSWQEPPARKLTVPATQCPKGIRALLLHVLGDDEVSLERFLNWAAHIYQTNGRAGTAWVWSGTQGTGKGLVMNEIMKPLFGYVVTTLASAFKDQFNSQLEECTILNVDECSFDKSDKKSDEKLKVIITGETLSIRGMHQAAREVPNFISAILTSNSCVVADLPRGDRRFNVSPPQPVKLEKKYPDTDAIVAKVRRELPTFAGFLAQYKVDAQKVRAAMASDAKTNMIEAGETGPEAFAHALIDGDLDYFVTSYFDIAQMPATRDDTRNREYFCEAVVEWLEAFEPDTDVAIPSATVCAIYNALFDPRPPMTVDSIGRFLARQGLKSLNRKLGLRARGYCVRWQTPKNIDADRAEMKALRNGKF